MLTAGIWKGSKNKEAAWKFARYLMTDYPMRRKHTTGIYGALTPEQLEWPEYYPTNLKPAHGKQVFWKALQVGQVDTAYPSDRMPGVVSKYVNAIVSNKMEPAVALNALTKEFNDIFKTMKK